MNLINKFRNGDITLWQSFWIGGIGGFICIQMLNTLIFSLNLGIIISVVPIICVLGMIFISIGVCRSANRYSGSKWYSILSKVICLLLFIIQLVSLVQSFIFWGSIFYDPRIVRLVPPLTMLVALIISFFIWRSKPKE